MSSCSLLSFSLFVSLSVVLRIVAFTPFALARRQNNNNSKMMPPGMAKELTAQEKVNQEWDGMAGEWDDLAAGYAKAFYNLLWKETGLDRKELQDKAIIVDFGCGTGLLTAMLRPVASQVLAIDASSKMIDLLQEKIKAREWENVQAHAIQLGNLAQAEESARKAVEDMDGKVDLVVASSVLTFVPEEDIQATMAGIGRLLKPGGIFCHSDWPKSEAKNPNAMTTEKAEKFFAMAGMVAESTQIRKMSMGGEDMDVFIGVARKP